MTVLESPSQSWFVLEKNICKIRVELTFAAKVKIETSENSKIFLSDLNQYHVQLWYKSGVHRNTFRDSSPALTEYPT